MICKNSSTLKSVATLSSLLLLILVLSFNFFWFYRMVRQRSPVLSQKPKTDYAILQYQHPLIPLVSATVSPVVLAQSYILIDNDTNTILTSKNPKAIIYPASITKLATALTALNIYPLDEIVTINQAYTRGKVMNLRPGEKITVKDLISALLVYSANDAAFNLASHHGQGISGFVDQMNLIAAKYQLTQTHFVNYDGIHDNNHFSTVYDLAQLGRLSIKNPIVKEVVKSKNLTVSSTDNLIRHQLTSTNELLGVIPEIEGLKTGWTPEAGGCFLGLINFNGHYLISVVAQSPDRFADTRALIDWAKNNLSWQSYQ